LTAQYPDPWPKAPVPLRETVCGLPGALSVTDSVPVRAPVVPGVNVTSIWQLAPDTRFTPQVLVSLKFAVLEIFPIFKVVVPKSLSVINQGEPVVPTLWLPK
jgi:hypothetical protein